MFLNGAKNVADNVGAVFHNIVGAPDPFFERVRTSATAVYRLAVEPPPDTAPGKDFSLGARVKRDGLTVVANRRAVAASPAPVNAAAPPPRFVEEATKPSTVDEQLQRAIATGRAPRGLEITLARAVRRAVDPSQVTVDVSVEIPASSMGPFETVLGIVDERGAIRTSKKQVGSAGRRGPNRLEFLRAAVTGQLQAALRRRQTGQAPSAASSQRLRRA